MDGRWTVGGCSMETLIGDLLLSLKLIKLKEVSLHYPYMYVDHFSSHVLHEIWASKGYESMEGIVSRCEGISRSVNTAQVPAAGIMMIS